MRRPFLAALLCAAVGACLSGIARADAAALKERREKALLAVSSDGEAVERAKAVADLAALDDADSAKALAECVHALGVRTEQIEKARAQCAEAYKPFSGFNLKDKKEWETKERLLEQLEKQDEQLQALQVVTQAAFTAVTRVRNATAVTALLGAVSAESDERARMILWPGLVANPATKGVEVTKRAVKDESVFVRIKVYEAIGMRKEVGLLDSAAQGLREAGWPARQAAVKALMLLGDVRGVLPLVTAMQNEEGGLLDDYAKALRFLTGETGISTDPESWRRWYDEHKEALAQKGATGVMPKPGTRVRVPLDYYGIETLSRRVLFVIDVSGSMKEEIGREGEETGVSKKDQAYSGPKIEIAKRVLSEAVHKLARDAKFNIVFFNHQVQTFQDSMVVATDDMKGKADLMITDLQPAGTTWAYGALRTCFEFAGATDASGKTVKEFDPQVDTIFFLSDGAPTDDATEDAKPMEPKVILDAVREWNGMAHIRIHTIAIDPRIGKGTFVRFMKSLANENGGTYTEIGSK